MESDNIELLSLQELINLREKYENMISFIKNAIRNEKLTYSEMEMYIKMLDALPKLIKNIRYEIDSRNRNADNIFSNLASSSSFSRPDPLPTSRSPPGSPPSYFFTYERSPSNSPNRSKSNSPVSSIHISPIGSPVQNRKSTPSPSPPESPSTRTQRKKKEYEEAKQEEKKAWRKKNPIMAAFGFGY